MEPIDGFPINCYCCGKFISSFDIDDDKAKNFDLEKTSEKTGLKEHLDVWVCPECLS